MGLTFLLFRRKVHKKREKKVIPTDNKNKAEKQKQAESHRVK